MVQLSMFAFLALLEGMAVLVLVLGIMIWRQRRLHNGTRIQYIDATEEYPTPSLYLDSEAAKTQTFVEALRTQPKAEPDDPALRAALGLRAGLLRQESELAKSPVAERDPALWVALAQQIAATIGAEGFAHQAQKSHEIYGEDTDASEVIVAQQTRTIQHLREYIQQLLENLGHQPLPDANMMEHFDNLERANRELNQCVVVLEDENSFLRDQIAALLKISHTSGGA